MKKKIIPFSQIAYGWNNIINALTRHTVMAFGTYDVDWFAKNHNGSGVNQNRKGTSVSRNIFLNGKPIKDLEGIIVNYVHGHNYFLICIPYHYLFPQNGYRVTTLHIEEGTKFMDGYMGEVNLYLINDRWVLEKPSVLEDKDYSSLLTISDLFNKEELSLKEGNKVTSNINITYPFIYGHIFSLKEKEGCFSLQFNNLKVVANKSAISVLDNENVLGSFPYTFRVDEQYELSFSLDSHALAIALDGVICFKCDYHPQNKGGRLIISADKGESSHKTTYLGKKYKKPIIDYYGQETYYVQTHSGKLDFKGRYAVYDPYDGLITNRATFEWPEGSLNDLHQINEGTWIVTIKATDSLGFVSTHKVTVIASEIEEIKDDDVVDLVPVNINKYFEANPTDFEYLNTVYEYNDDMSTFMAFSSEPRPRKNVVRLYETWDECRQALKFVKWDNSDPSINHFEIVLATDRELKNVVEEDRNISKETNSYRFLNLLINQDYYYQISTVFNEKTIKSKVFHFKTKGYSRLLDVEGMSNFRDCGGYHTEYGEIKQGLMFRGSRLDDMTEKGRDIILNKLHIKCDLDLRGSGEGIINPLNLSHYYQISVPWYIVTINDEKQYPKCKEALSVFCEKENYPLYFHCSVGRDRTGTFAAIVDALLGADEERVLKNYFTSMFSVTGTIPKPMTGFAENFMYFLKGLKGLGGSSLKENAEIFAHKVGITDEQIENLRKIMTGKI